jgi:hypothetical protein
MKTMTLVEVLPHNSGYCSILTESPHDLPVGQEQNAIVSLQGEEIARWEGWMLTTACVTGDGILCAAVNGHMYLVRNNGEIESIRHEREEDWYRASANLNGANCLFGGDLGRMMSFSLTSRRLRHLALNEYNIQKPGRGILKIYVSRNGSFLLGENELLLQFRDNSLFECYSQTKRTNKCFWDATALDTTLWIVTCDGPTPLLAEFQMGSGPLTYHQLPMLPNVEVPALMAFNGYLCTGVNEIYYGLPGSWRKIGEFEEEPIARLLTLANQPNSILAVGYTGKTKIIPVR